MQPQVVSREFVEVDDDVVAVIDQRIFDLDGILVRGPVVVFHRYSFRAGFVSRMTVSQRREDALARWPLPIVLGQAVVRW